MVDKIHRFIYIACLMILGLWFLSWVLEWIVFKDYHNSPLKRIVDILWLIAPFAPIGTLFGTLKEDQSPRKKMTIIFFTGLSVVFLILFVWGSAYAAAFD